MQIFTLLNYKKKWVVPGRNEIDETQELYYPAIIKVIAGTGYKGFVGQEFIVKTILRR